MSEDLKAYMQGVNSSGYLFQLRIEHEVKVSQLNHHWQVLATEHRWTDKESNESGFIDLVLNYEALRIVIECKRVQDTSLLFLNPSRIGMNNFAYLYWCHSQKEKRYIADWDQFDFSQSFPRSEFCIQYPKEKMQLESVASGLLRSIESLARQEGRINQPENGQNYVYIPMIVTSAPLYLCKFDIAKVELTDGMLKDGSQTFEQVPFVAFQKGLNTGPANENRARLRRKLGRDPGLQLLNKKLVQTVFVVDVSYLITFLREMELDKAYTTPWPWVSVRNMEDAGEYT